MHTHILTTPRVPSGDISSVKVLGQRIVILNSLQACIDLFEKRSSIYSDRPSLVMAGELMGWDHLLPLCHYGDLFRDFRRLLFQFMGGPKQMARFHGLEEKETHQFLRRLLQSPDKVREHIRT